MKILLKIWVSQNQKLLFDTQKTFLKNPQKYQNAGCSWFVSRVIQNLCIIKWGDRGYPIVCFGYKIESKSYLVVEISAKEVLVYYMTYREKQFC